MCLHISLYINQKIAENFIVDEYVDEGSRK
jgi:hypothetical protein